MLLVIVIEMLQPWSRIAWARILDNIVGSLALLLAVLALWPDLGVPLEECLRVGIGANHADHEELGNDAVEANRAVLAEAVVAITFRLEAVATETSFDANVAKLGAPTGRRGLGFGHCRPGGKERRDCDCKRRRQG